MSELREDERASERERPLRSWVGRSLVRLVAALKATAAPPAAVTDERNPARKKMTCALPAERKEGRQGEYKFTNLFLAGSPGPPLRRRPSPTTTTTGLVGSFNIAAGDRCCCCKMDVVLGGATGDARTTLATLLGTTSTLLSSSSPSPSITSPSSSDSLEITKEALVVRKERGFPIKHTCHCDGLLAVHGADARLRSQSGSALATAEEMVRRSRGIRRRHDVGVGRRRRRRVLEQSIRCRRRFVDVLLAKK